MDINSLKKRVISFDSVQNKSFGLLFLTIIIVMIFILAAIRPSLIKITEIQKEVNDNTIYNEQLKTKIANLNALQAIISPQEVQDKLAVFENVLPTESKVHELLVNVSEFAAANSLVVSNVAVDETTKLVESESEINPDLQKFKLVYSLKGDPSNFVTFIDKISKYPRAIQIANIGMSKDSEGKYIFRFDMTAYYLPVK